MNDEPAQDQIEAIRKVILSGVAGDFQDVADAVHTQYRIRVGAGLVEQVYRQMKDEERAAAKEAAIETHRRQPSQEDAAAEETFHKVLRFAQQMGGFDQARAALDAVEKKLRELI